MTASVLADIVRVCWFAVILAILIFYLLYRRNKIQEFEKTIELEKVTNHDAYSQLSDTDLLKLTNSNNQSRPGSPEYVKPTKPKS